MRRLLLAVALSAAVGLGGASSQPSEDQRPQGAAKGQVERPSDEESKQAASQPAPEQRAPLVVVYGGKESPAKGQSGEPEIKEPWWDRATQDPGDAFNGVIALVTIILAGIGMYQAWIARESARQQLRAYIVIEGKGFKSFTADSEIKTQILVKNVGQTPAYRVNVAAAMKLLETVPDEDLTGTADMEAPPRDNAFGPDSSKLVVIGDDLFMTAAELDLFRSKERCVLVYGYAEYRDVFKHTRRTSFCHMYTGAAHNDCGYIRHGNHAD